jgi:hypothetical protein
VGSIIKNDQTITKLFEKLQRPNPPRVDLPPGLVHYLSELDDYLRRLSAAIGPGISSGGASHHLTHENGGIDEISVTGLSGLLADDQNPLVHNITGARHNGFPGGVVKFLREDATWQSPSGGASGTVFYTTEVDLGSTPALNGHVDFAHTGGTLISNTSILVEQAQGPYTGKGLSTNIDEAEQDIIDFVGYAFDTANIRVFWESKNFVRGKYKIIYIVPGTGSTDTSPLRKYDEWIQVTQNNSAKTYVDSRDWRGLFLRCSFVVHQGTVADAQARQWGGSGGTTVYNFVFGPTFDSLGIPPTDIQLMQGGSNTVVRLWIETGTGKLYVTVDSFLFELQVRFIVEGFVSKGGPDRTI